MKLKILPQTVKNSQLRNYKANVQAISSNKNSINNNNGLRSSMNGAIFGNASTITQQ